MLELRDNIGKEGDILNKYDFKKIGKFLEKKRNEEGYSLEYLAMKGEQSITTLCRLEKGDGPKKIEKAIEAYEKYCSLFGFTVEEVYQIIRLEEPDELRTRLEIAEVSIDLKQSLKEDIERLEQLEVYAEVYSKEKAWITFLKAKAFFYLGQLEKAKAAATKVIESEEANSENLKSAAHNLLANYYYANNDIPSALMEIEEGIKSFKGSSRMDVYYGLLSFKVLLLRNSYEELEELIQNHHQIQNAHITCLVFECKARNELERKKYDKAICSAIAGLKIAAKEQKFDRSVELWEVLGKVYEEKGDFDTAERAYKKALKLEGKVDQKLLTTIYNRLGYLKLKQDQLDQVQEYINHAFSIDHVGPRILETYCLQGRLWIRKGKMKQAVSILEKGVKIAEKFGAKEAAQNIVTLLLSCLQENEPKYFEYLNTFFKLSQT